VLCGSRYWPGGVYCIDDRIHVVLPEREVEGVELRPDTLQYGLERRHSLAPAARNEGQDQSGASDI
jgi:hypothetical protein